MLALSWTSLVILLTLGTSRSAAKLGDVRLSGGAKWYGRVDVNMPGWYSVCDTDWDEADAKVVCRQLGFRHGIALCCGAVGYNYKPARLNRVHCAGNESRLIDCPTSPSSDRYCYSRNYASVLCHNRELQANYSDILIGTPRQPSGDVDLRYMAINGTICSDGWDDVDASVACREAGYPDGYAYHHYRDWIIRSDSVNPGPYWTTNVTCTGNERKLSECGHVEFGKVRECKSGHHAGALCHTKDIEFRITGDGNPRAGRVEVSVNGVWGSLCNQDWHSDDATVLCRQFGYIGGDISTTVYPNPPAAMFINAPQCTGSEDHMLDCPHRGWRNVDARDRQCRSHRTDVIVKCHGPVRLYSRRLRNPTHGPVTFFRNGAWYPVCDTGFNDYTARLACTDMGFVDGRAICCSAYGKPWTRLQFNSYRVSCDRGNETSIGECVKEIPCNSTHYASVVCFRQTQLPISDAYDFSVTESPTGRGQVVVEHYGIEGRVCFQSWSDTEASVLCRSLGYPGGIAYHHTLHGQIRVEAPYMISHVTCTGRESRLSQCSFRSRLELGECAENLVAGVLCLNQTDDVQYRIVGPIPNSGRVEVGVDGVWGTVCSTWWGAEEATVLCRQLNYTGGGITPSTENITSIGEGPHWLSHLQCVGSETSLHDCPHVGFATVVSDLIAIYPNGSMVYHAACSSHSMDATVHCYPGSTSVAPVTTHMPTTPVPTTTIPTTAIPTTTMPTTPLPTTPIPTTMIPTPPLPTTPMPTTARSTTPLPTTQRPTTPRPTTTPVPTTPMPTTWTQTTQTATTLRSTTTQTHSLTTETSRTETESTVDTGFSSATTVYITNDSTADGNGSYVMGGQNDDDDTGVHPVAIIIPILIITIVICIVIFIIVYRRHKRSKNQSRRAGPRDDRIMFAYDGDSVDWTTAEANSNNHANNSATVPQNNGLFYSEPVIDYAFYDKDGVQFGSFGRASNADSGRGSPSQLYSSIPIRRQPSVVRFAEDNTYIDESLPVAEPSLYYNIGHTYNDDDIPTPRISKA